MESQKTELSKLMNNEIVVAAGLRNNKFNHTLFWFLFHRITNRLAAIGGQFDHLVGEKGLPDASAWALTKFCNPTQVRGSENIPQQGPLLVISNHPGAYDGLILFSYLKRQDIRWISSDIPAFHLLKNTRKHILFSSRTDCSDHFLVMRNAIRHLRGGGTLVYLASGGRDPDPAVYSGADLAMDNWLDTFEAFYKYVPGLRILPAVVSNVISPIWAYHPITWLRREEGWKHILSEFGQVINQLAHPGRLMISPAVSFGKSFSEAEIRQEIGDKNPRAAVIARGKSLLKDHCNNVLG
ncbi:MAG: phospholipid/glycerol acyltransferase [Chloroflexi bacterium]|nr:MAG: phospholipid/glycerol acyltransferase [Chloroflexota bacterium]